MPSCFTGDCETTKEDFLQIFSSLLPRGPIWEFGCSEEYDAFWCAVASCFSQTQNRMCEIPSLILPCDTTETARVADIWGYPSSCVGAPEDNEALCEWIDFINEACSPGSVQFLRDVLAFFECEGVTLEESFSPDEITAEPVVTMECVSGEVGCVSANQPFSSLEVAYCKTYLHVTMNSALVDIDQMGVGACCLPASGPICQVSSTKIECLINEFIPAHIIPVFNII